MNIEAALRSHLAGYATLAAVVGSRVYPVQLPDGVTLPAVSYTRISTVPSQHRSSRLAQYSRPRFQVDGWAATYGEAVQLRYLLRAAMADFERDSNPRVDVALLAGDRDVVEADAGRFRASLDYMISHSEE
jgi:hypothetical protein